MPHSRSSAPTHTSRHVFLNLCQAADGWMSGQEEEMTRKVWFKNVLKASIDYTYLNPFYSAFKVESFWRLRATLHSLWKKWGLEWHEREKKTLQRLKKDAYQVRSESWLGKQVIGERPAHMTCSNNPQKIWNTSTVSLITRLIQLHTVTAAGHTLQELLQPF